MTLYNPYEQIDPKFDSSRIKIIYTPTSELYLPKVSLNFSSLQSALPPEEITVRDEAWKKACAKEPLEDEAMISARFIDRNNGDIKGAPARYKDWKTMAKQSFYAKFGDMYIPNMMNVQMLAETKDHYVVLGDRPAKESGKLPAFQVPGGTLSPTDRRDGYIAPDVGAVREFYEEVGRIHLKNVSYLGTSFYSGRVITTSYYTGTIPMTAAELIKWRESNRKEIKDYAAFPYEFFVPVMGITDVMSCYKDRLRETAEVGLILKGKQTFGRLWYRANCPYRMRGE